MMTTIDETPDPDRIDDVQQASLQAGTSNIEEQDPGQFELDELTPEEQAALEQADTGPEGEADDGASGDIDIDQAPQESAPGGSGIQRQPKGDIDKGAKRWYLAPCLSRLLAEVNRRWPRRDKTGDRTIGPGDHLPNNQERVDGLDIDKDGVRPMEIVNAAKKHPSTNYIIFNGIVWIRSQGFRPMKIRYGSTAYTTRVHISIRRTPAAANNKTRWGIWPRSRY
ncbi:hypothetical protein [Massilia pseudoviolaceinigra]|uniref:hypothetical protein n=1 Tax=Massilia pseudoviolaceinigra TaxID=3057165 RepID=UPI0027966C90|nr:hypothetical protein [Massilia sp. CCM 9206]MDQ1918813.1 hypothetical protein [Massilia sp. CCM 9206]